jgi:hypothetical protein
MKRGILVVALSLLFLVPTAAWAAPPEGVGRPVLPIDAHTLDGYHAGDLIAMIESLQAQVAVLTAYIRVEDQPINGLAGPHVIVEGANLIVQNGSGKTYLANGLGNLVMGYNEAEDADIGKRDGSHNVIVGSEHEYTSYGGLVVGWQNKILGNFATVSGGTNNTASGDRSSVSGGTHNTASGNGSSISGGLFNEAIVKFGSISGGRENIATDWAASSVSGGYRNTARGAYSNVSGGYDNEASGWYSSISGGNNITVTGEYDWATGGISSGSDYVFITSDDRLVIGTSGNAIKMSKDGMLDLYSNFRARLSSPNLAEVRSDGLLDLRGSIIKLNGGGKPASGIGDIVVSGGAGVPSPITTGSPTVLLP